jgi:hypothetical protein
MNFPITPDKLAEFLVEAKIVTYASGTDEYTVSPDLPASHQLEYSKRKLTYKDVYFGGLAFIGFETAYFEAEPIWGMSYYGSVLEGGSETEIAGMPPFLKAALREIPTEAPFRGPATYHQDEYSYNNEIHGALAQFNGIEIIYCKSKPIYKLFYSGGIVR